MKQEQAYKIRLSEDLHSELHANGIEHDTEDDQLRVTLYFDVERAAKHFELTPQHNLVFRNNRKPQVITDEENPFHVDSMLNSVAVKIRTNDFPFTRYLIDKILETKSTYVRLDEFFDILDAQKEKMEQLEPRRQQLQQEKEAELEKEKAEQEEKQQREQAARRAHNEKTKKQREEMEEYIDTFLENHASNRLRKCVGKGYNCRKATIQEMVKYYLGDEWVLDYNEQVDVKDRSCPSEAAIDKHIELEQANIPFMKDIVVKWLPNGFDQLDDVDHFTEEGSEAIEAKYLGEWVYLPSDSFDDYPRLTDDDIYRYAAGRMDIELGADGWTGADLKVEDNVLHILGDVEKLDGYTNAEIRQYIDEAIRLFREFEREDEENKYMD